MSSTDVAPRFQRWVGQTSNLDRCTRCGRPRSVHGPDWSCPSGRPHGAASAALIAGSLLAVAGVALRLTSAIANHQVPAALFLAGVILAMAGFSLLGPPKEHPKS
ncbi:MAG TPA: hypothetical protein VMA72_19395 [Streptosporangiaceae bacterium]|nr:hypothetical protein [Streptosporangiaceae bacterium]